MDAKGRRPLQCSCLCQKALRERRGTHSSLFPGDAAPSEVPVTVNIPPKPTSENAMLQDFALFYTDGLHFAPCTSLVDHLTQCDPAKGKILIDDAWKGDVEGT